MSYRIFALITPILFGFMAVNLEAADIDKMAGDCQGCHGANGVSECPDMPTIAGVSAVFTEDAMFAYQDKARPCETSEYRHGDTSRPATDMCQIAGAMTEDQIVEIAAYFAGKKFVAMKQTTDPAKAKAGKVVHDDACESCHSDGGSNPDDEMGLLAGQPMGYLKQTFKEFRADEREQPKKMKKTVDELSDADVEALVHFYASQQ